MYAVSRQGRKRVKFADEIERPANRLDFTTPKTTSPRIAFKPLWDSK